MNNIITNQNTETITSMEVATMIGKEHSQLLKDIRKYITQLGKVNFDFSDFFIESTYISEQNKELPCFNVTRKGCEFIANKLTGQKCTEFAVRYVAKFYELEEGNITSSFISALNAIIESINLTR